MLKIQTDRRAFEARLEPEAERCVIEGLRQLRDLQMALARAFARIDASGHFALTKPCHASIFEYGCKLGYSALEVQTFTNLGKTLAAAPQAEARVRSGTVSVEAAAAIGRILGNPDLVRPNDDWLEAARSTSLKTLRRNIRKRIEVHALGASSGIEEVTVYVAARTKDDFERAREVASQKAGKPLTHGQTFGRVVAFYLDKNDPLRQKGGARRLGPTDDLPGSRYVPRDVVRQIWARAGGCCEVPGCSHRMHLELAHRVPHARGSGREPKDLGLLCHRHHLLYDAGKIPWPVPRPPPSGDAGGASRVGERLATYMASRSRPPPPAGALQGRVFGGQSPEASLQRPVSRGQSPGPGNPAPRARGKGAEDGSGGRT